MEDLNLTSEQKELLESLTEEQQDVFQFAVESEGFEIEEALSVAENEEYHLFESVYELVDFMTYENGLVLDEMPQWMESIIGMHGLDVLGMSGILWMVKINTKALTNIRAVKLQSCGVKKSIGNLKTAVLFL